MITITLESDYPKLDNYDVVVMCGGYNAATEQQYVVSERMNSSQQSVRLTAQKAHSIEVRIYLTPKTMPSGKGIEIKLMPDFEVMVSIDNDSKPIYNATHQINAWGGASLKLTFEL